MRKTMTKNALSVGRAAEFLGISEATVRNWRRNGLLPNTKSFDPEALAALKKRIVSGELPRLNRRANKRGSRRSAHRVSEDRYFYWMALAVLEQAGELEREPAVFDPAGFRTIRRAAVRELLTDWWQRKLRRLSWGRTTCRLPSPLRAEGGDWFGETLEARRSAGARSGSGIFYTPPELADARLAEIPPAGCWFEPGCGTGRFLLSAARRGVPFDALYGADCDALALRLAALNLLLAFPGEDRKPHLVCADLLKTAPFGGRRFQVVAANPPWGRIPCADRKSLQKRFGERFSSERFALFLARACDWCAPGGTLLFLLPDSFLGVRRHRATREWLSRYRILSIERLDRPFKGVFSDSAALLWRNEPADPHETFRWIDGSGDRLRRHDELPDAHAECRASDPMEAILFEKLRRHPLVTLAGNAEWTLGIVTGDNRRHLLPAGTPGAEPVLRGCDIRPMRILPPRAAIRFTPERYQQTAPESRYRTGEKLVYRFVAARPVFAVDRERRLTLNSANILVVPPEFYPASVLAAILNSTLYGLFYRRCHATRKILRADLESLPLPLLDHAQRARLAAVAADAEAGRAAPEELRARIDDAVADLFELTSPERALLRALAPKWQ